MTTTVVEQVATVKTPSFGTVTRFYVRTGDVVKQGAQLGIFVSSAGVEPLQAPAGGIVRLATREGQHLEQGSVVATITPGPVSPLPNREPRVKPPLAAPGKPHEARPVRARVDKAKPVQALSEPQGSNGRRSNGSTPPLVDELVVEPPKAVRQTAPEPTTPRGNKKPRTPKRTKNRTYSIGEHQEAAIAKLSARLRLDDNAPQANESELVRVAIEMLLALPQPALHAMITANKAREAREGFGTGRPRPQ